MWSAPSPCQNRCAISTWSHCIITCQTFPCVMKDEFDLSSTGYTIKSHTRVTIVHCKSVVRLRYRKCSSKSNRLSARSGTAAWRHEKRGWVSRGDRSRARDWGGTGGGRGSMRCHSRHSKTCHAFVWHLSACPRHSRGDRALPSPSVHGRTSYYRLCLQTRRVCVAQWQVFYPKSIPNAHCISNLHFSKL